MYTRKICFLGMLLAYIKYSYSNLNYFIKDKKMKVSSLLSQITTAKTAESHTPQDPNAFQQLLDGAGQNSVGQEKKESWNTYFDKHIHRYAEYDNTMGIKETYGNVLIKTAEQDGLDDPKKMLLSLSAEELNAVQRAHRIAKPLTPQRINSLTDEGAYNLLVEPDKTRDIDGNGITAIADANIIKFPTEHTDPAVAKAWNEFTSELSFKDKMMAEAKIMTSFFSANFNAETGVQRDPNDPEFVNPFNEPDFSFKDWVNDIYGGLEFQRGEMGEDEFQRQMAIWKLFENKLDKYNAA